MHLRLYRPDETPEVSAHSTLEAFFEDWYVPKVTSDRRRKPPKEATIKRRREALAWWPRLMASPQRPNGPLLCEITDESLAVFAEKLSHATYTRGIKRKPLSPATQYGTINEILIVLHAAGPKQGRLLRAALISDTPSIYLEQPARWPKDHWTLDEAKKVALAVNSMDAPPRWQHGTFAFHQLMRAMLALMFYTGERAGTYRQLTRGSLTEAHPGQWWLYIAAAVKTSKVRRCAVHPRLRQELQESAKLIPSDLLVPWPISYSAIDKHHDDLQAAAGLPLSRRFTMQAWRRLHASTMEGLGFRMAESLAQQSLCHSSPTVTRASYTAAVDAALLMFPDIFEEAS